MGGALWLHTWCSRNSHLLGPWPPVALCLGPQPPRDLSFLKPILHPTQDPAQFGGAPLLLSQVLTLGAPQVQPNLREGDRVQGMTSIRLQLSCQSLAPVQVF